MAEMKEKGGNLLTFPKSFNTLWLFLHPLKAKLTHTQTRRERERMEDRVTPNKNDIVDKPHDKHNPI